MEKADIKGQPFYVHSYRTTHYYCRLKSKIYLICFCGSLGSRSAHFGIFWNRRQPKVGDGRIDRMFWGGRWFKRKLAWKLKNMLNCAYRMSENSRTDWSCTERLLCMYVNWVVSINETECVYCEVRAEFLNVIHIKTSRTFCCYIHDHI
jgi:hypothetical protein